MPISIHLSDRRNVWSTWSVNQSVRQLIPGLILRIFKKYFRIIILYLSLYRYITLLVFQKVRTITKES